MNAWDSYFLFHTYLHTLHDAEKKAFTPSPPAPPSEDWMSKTFLSHHSECCRAKNFLYKCCCDKFIRGRGRCRLAKWLSHTPLVPSAWYHNHHPYLLESEFKSSKIRFGTPNRISLVPEDSSSILGCNSPFSCAFEFQIYILESCYRKLNDKWSQCHLAEEEECNCFVKRLVVSE